MFRVVFDRDGRNVFDMTVGETGFNGINACVLSRVTAGVTK